MCLFDNIHVTLKDAEERVKIEEKQKELEENYEKSIKNFEAEIQRLQKLVRNEQVKYNELTFKQSTNENGKEQILTEFENEIRLLKEKNERYKTKIEKLEDERNAFQTTVKTLRKSIEKHIEDKNNLRTEIEGRKNENEIIKTETEKLRLDISRLECELGKQKNVFNGEIKTYQAEIKLLENKNEKSREEIKKLKENFEDLKNSETKRAIQVTLSSVVPPNVNPSRNSPNALYLKTPLLTKSIPIPSEWICMIQVINTLNNKGNQSVRCKMTGKFANIHTDLVLWPKKTEDIVALNSCVPMKNLKPLRGNNYPLIYEKLLN